MNISPTFTLLKTLGATIGSKAIVFLGFIFSKWHISFTFIFAFILLTHAGLMCVQQHSFQPLIDEVGMKLLRIDNDIHNEMVIFEENNQVIPVNVNEMGIFKKIYTIGYYYVDIISGLWFLGIFIYLIFKILGKINTSEELKYFLIAVGIVFMFQVLVGFLVYVGDYNELGGITTSEKLNNLWVEINPIKGITKLMINLPYLIIPIIDSSNIIPQTTED